MLKVKKHDRIKTLMLETEDGALCKYCPLDEDQKHTRSAPNNFGYVSCEGCCCSDAYDIACEELECEDLRDVNLDAELKLIEASWSYQIQKYIVELLRGK